MKGNQSGNALAAYFIQSLKVARSGGTLHSYMIELWSVPPWRSPIVCLCLSTVMSEQALTVAARAATPSVYASSVVLEVCARSQHAVRVMRHGRCVELETSGMGDDGG